MSQNSWSVLPNQDTIIGGASFRIMLTIALENIERKRVRFLINKASNKFLVANWNKPLRSLLVGFEISSLLQCNFVSFKRVKQYDDMNIGYVYAVKVFKGLAFIGGHSKVVLMDTVRRRILKSVVLDSLVSNRHGESVLCIYGRFNFVI